MRFPRLFWGLLSSDESQTVGWGASTAGPGGRTADPATVRGGPTDVPDLREAWPGILAEFQRARRYERIITIAVLTVARASASVSPGAGDKDGHPSSDNRPRGQGRGGDDIPVVLAAALRRAVRETDLVAWDPVTRRCLIVMPEIGVEEGRQAVSRMQAVCGSAVGCVLGADVAEFPADGWTFEDLLEAARQKRRVSDLRHAARVFESAAPSEARGADAVPGAAATSKG